MDKGGILGKMKEHLRAENNRDDEVEICHHFTSKTHSFDLKNLTWNTTSISGFQSTKSTGDAEDEKIKEELSKELSNTNFNVLQKLSELKELLYVLMYIDESCDPVNKIYYCDLSALPKGLEGYKGTNELLPFVKLVDNFEALYEYVANDDTIFTFLTNKDAPRYKLVRVDLKEPSSWIEVLKEDKKDLLESATAVNSNRLVLRYLSNVKNMLQVRDLRTGDLLHQLPLDIGTVTKISCSRKDSIIFIGFTSFLLPGIIYMCNLECEAPEMRIFREIVVPGFDKTEFEANKVFVPSKDGTKIPMFIVARKGLFLDGSHPCLLYAYGGFNICIPPYFAAGHIVLEKHLDTVVCIANIRGGGGYGEEWHKAGVLAKKQNSFDDFISAAEYLISAGYTQPKKLCIEGGSNGGLLIGACINQRPDLFGCALAHVGVMDMLRFHKFTIDEEMFSNGGSFVY